MTAVIRGSLWDIGSKFMAIVLLPASSLLQMSSVREACCKFLMRQLHPSNCLGIRSFADAHSCKELHKRSHRFALQNFQEVMNTEEFLLLPFSEVEELISNSQLNIPSEEKVFLAVLSWVKHDIAERVQNIGKVEAVCLQYIVSVSATIRDATGGSL
ncbi:hypothetical protein LSTR_LSTR013046 [Laodelphax striatellus]|uniref:BACK domain-containing protein n=1 Tax=Laodelphax striatellus TaxID=195883 RepID=A0A482XCV5_LAOST|nr:hypothetical protein LSTR_LSTR013046 [Laodelphax striatellus]